MDYGYIASFAPHVGPLRSMLILVLATRRPNTPALPAELWDTIFNTHFSNGTMATVSTDGRATIYDLDSQRVVKQFDTFPDCQSCVWMPSQSILATTHQLGVLLWGVDTDTERYLAWDCVYSCVDTCECSPGGNVLFAVSDEQLLYKWHIDRTARPVMTLASLMHTTQQGTVYSAINADGTLLAIGSRSVKVEIWNTEPLQIRQVYNHGSIVTECVFLRDVLYVACVDAVYRLSETSEGVVFWTEEIRRSAISPDEEIRSVAISPDGRHLVVATVLTLQMQCAETFRIFHKAQTEGVWHCSFSRNGAYLVLLTNEGCPRLWRVTGNVFTFEPY